MTCEKYVGDLEENLKKIPCYENSSLSFSGGLDSSIIAFLMRDCEPQLYAIGFEDSRDLKNANEISSVLGLKLNTILIEDEDVLNAIKILKDIGEMSAMEIAFEMPLLIVSMHATSRRIYTGQGADELFGGYAKYLQNPELMHEDVEKLLKITLPRERKITAKYEKELITPYLSEDIIALASEIPKECKIKNGVRKWVLREAARRLGVPEIIVQREKKAAQYGSGIWKHMKKLAKREGKSVEEFIRGI